ncbi:monofunctional biosynthetic peptidoglycan transglycosylase [Fulvimarina pelagi HTCC2506]|uniref:Biosynthetic peptidoglycan transglycosylase n=2 Tax=Fulvimarina pelagi TaxID=217511 RepID=Q0FZD4_9HYPH|nr:transglycosylase domain-containing protein [Fulvimarina pelagi]EAU40344.1 monofunctional biosynthetic peptidoglycan transglycosylase [Fulvimarina pelagi HTCC2506]BAT31381.1 monofunctional biosynthetic peptidoglycan transglycosylase [Fulvimarina pelagi]
MLRKIVIAAILSGLVLAAIPLILVPVYTIQPVHPVSTLILRDHFTFRPYLRDWVDLEEIAPVMRYSVIMSEDGQFCRHDGVDWVEMKAVVDQFLDGEETRGASTIPMQTAKNLFLWNGRSYVRKAIELPLALYLNLVVSKDRILEIYLNIAEWDEGIYGIEAASQHYFGQSASSLTERQAALLTVTLPNPAGRNPAAPTRRMNALADRVQRLARASGDYVGCVKTEA